MSKTAGKKNRIIFLDLIRAFAALMMVQGHTVDVFLGSQYRSYDSTFYLLWLTNRGMTAPIFLFTAGATFTYLFKLHKEPFFENPRAGKGFKRFLLLLFVGYLLRFPSPRIYDVFSARPDLWKTFYSVDVLQLIAFGILFIMLGILLAEKLRIKESIVFIVFSVVFFLLYPVFENIKWTEFLHPFFAGYFYKGSGSNFPLFPWLSYVFAGGVLGAYLAKSDQVFKNPKFALRVFIYGVGFMVLSGLGNEIEILLTGTSHFWTTSPNLVIYRLGFVIVETSVFIFIATKINSIPRFLILIGRNTLSIYVVHIVLLYGSPWSPGLMIFYHQAASVPITMLAAAGMILLMSGMVLLMNKLNIRNKPLVASS